jgi:hypothetical protein
MSTFVLPNSPGAAGAQSETRRRNGFFRPFTEFLDGIRLARAMAHRYEVLSRKSDAELAAAGIRREEIPSLVVNAKYAL